MSGISRALQWISALGVRNTGIQICSLRLPPSSRVAGTIGPASPSKEKVRLASAYPNRPADWDPRGEGFGSTQTRLLVYFAMIMREGLFCIQVKKRFLKTHRA